MFESMFVSIGGDFYQEVRFIRLRLVREVEIKIRVEFNFTSGRR